MDISCSNVDVCFDGHSYLESVDFSVGKNEVVLLYGPSGSGKTSLFKILCGLAKSTNHEGRVNWGDYPVESLEKANKERSSYISMIYSLFFFLENLPVEKNILLPAIFAGGSREEVARRLDAVYEAFSFSGSLSNLSLKEMRRRSIGELSNGQKELVGIARAFVLDSPFIFADEMLRSFNMEAEEMLWQKIMEEPALGIGSERGFFMITHKEHLRTDERIDKVYTIKDKSIVQI